MISSIAYNRGLEYLLPTKFDYYKARLIDTVPFVCMNYWRLICILN